MSPRRLLALFLAGLLALPALRAAEHTLTLADSRGRPVADAVVSLHPLDQPAPPAAQPAPEITIAQRDSEFVPLVTAVRVGTAVRFPNEDKIQHQVYSLSAAKRFEVPLHSGATAPAIALDQPGVVAVGCNIHDWMRSFVVVLDTPWFAISGRDGVARVSAPPGRYRREIWHFRLAAPLVTEITLTDDDAATEAVSLTLRRDRHPARREPGADATYP
ncbi:MAG: hypothetical protein MUE42_13245 [Opitutaceae bacterium]|jgi:plastocyanin|nr:hypothetical protein [Opitutaceae bacterium]